MRSVIVATSLLVVVATLFAALPQVEAAPQVWGGPDGWAYRISAAVNTSVNRTDLQVPFTFSTSSLITAGKMRSDCGDLRVRDMSDNPLSFWIESGCNTASTRLWVRMPQVIKGGSDQFVMYYGNPAATSISSPNGTFVANSIRVEVSDCDPFNFGAYCPIVNHSTADDVRDRSANRCATSRTKIEYGFPCSSTSVRTDYENGFGVEYRFLFVPDVSGTWTFETRADNWSELARSLTDGELVTSHSLIVTNYADDHGALTGTRTLAAGQGSWYSFVSSERNGVEEQRVRLQRPGGNLQVLSTTNFPGMLFRRNYADPMPSVLLHGEVTVPDQPTGGSAVGYIGQNNVTGKCDYPRGPGSACRLYGRDDGQSAWTLLQTTTLDSSGVAYIGYIDGELPPLQKRNYMMFINRTGQGDGLPLFFNGTTWGPPDAPDLLALESGNRTQTAFWSPASANGAVVTGYEVWVDPSDAPNRQWATVGASATNHTFSNLTNGILYNWTIRATSGIGTGPASDMLGDVPSGTPNPPVASAVPGNATAVVSWTPSFDQGAAQGFRLWYGTQLVANLGNVTTQTVTGLANGFSYTFNVTAYNVNGNSSSSNYVSVVPGARPYPPADLVATRGNGFVDLSWTPGFANGRPLTGYQIWRGTSSGTETLLATTADGGNTTFRVNGLTNGQLYFFNVTAMNAFGSSETSNEVSARPATTPSAPQGFAAAPGNRSAALTWSAPASNGGEPILGYRVYAETYPASGAIDLLATLESATNTSFTVNGLTNGVEYVFTLRAFNAVGDGTLAPSEQTTPGAPPDPPGNLDAVRGDEQVALYWTPGSANGDAVDSHTIYRGTSPEGATALAVVGGTNTTFADHEVANGVLYYYTVAATNSFGTSASSNMVSARPARAPDAPTLTGVVELNGTLEVSWSAPAEEGGEPLLYYELYEGTAAGASTLVFGINATSAQLERPNGVTYYFRVKAVSAAGASEYSNELSGAAGTVPYPPTDVAVVAGNASAVVSWSPPVDDGGRAITQYVVECGGCPAPASWSTTELNYTLTGLTNDVQYAASVRAVNSFGSGAAMAPVPFTPVTLPDPPADLVATRGDTTVALAWAHGFDGGSPLTGYDIWQNATLLATVSSANTSFVVNGLTNGVTYTFHLEALNAHGSSAPSNVVSAKPARAPDAPNLTAIAGSNNTIVLNWGAPANNGGEPVLSYKVYESTSSPAVDHILTTSDNYAQLARTNGVKQFYRITAVNAVGEGAFSNEGNGSAGGVPYPPTNLTASPGNRTVTFAWDPPTETGGHPITQYVVYCSCAAGNGLTSTTTATLTFSNLQNGVEYTGYVYATNSKGAGNPTPNVTFTAASVPHPPQLTSAMRGDREIALAWTPGSAEGSPIQHYRLYRGSSGGAPSFLTTVSTTSYVDTQLTNGVTYSYNLSAVNEIGTSAASNVLSAKPAGVPFAPTSLAAARGNHSATLTWTPGASNGEPLLGYDIFLDDGGGVDVWALSPFASTTDGSNTSFTANGLTNGVLHTFQVRARNVVGDGALSAAASVVPAGVPYPATLTSATRGNGNVSLAWKPGATNGDALTAVRVLQGTSPDALVEVETLAAGATNVTLGGLTNGVTYHFAIRQENSVGASVASNVLSARPATTPAAPQSLSATRANGSVELAWSAGATGGEPLLGYDVLVDGVLSAQTSDGANTSFTVNGLTNGVEYAFTLRARNEVGEGALSAERRATPASLPDPPLLLSATRGNGEVTLAWTPGYDQGSALTGTRLLRGTSPGSLSEVGSLAPGETSYTHTGLTNGVRYYFALQHTNDLGTSAASAVLDARPATTPSAPTGLVASFGNANVTLVWAPPANDGGEPVLAYTIRRGTNENALEPIASIGANTTFVAHGLTNGVTYFFRVVASNEVGAGTASLTANATPARAPDAPLALTAQSSSRQVALDWEPPAFDGGRPLLNYTVYRNGTFLQRIGTNTTYTASGLVDGVTYRFTVSATNLVGEGESTSEVDATPLSPPSAPLDLTATTLQPSIQLSWSPPASSGGSEVQQYRIFASTTPGGARWLVATVPGTQLSYEDAADPATTRYYVVTALNVVGEGPASGEAVGATPADPLQPAVPDTYRTCTRDGSTGAVACTEGSAEDVVGLAAGGRHTCALLADQRVDCWGDDAAGQSGDHLAGQPALAISAGTSHTCVLLDDGNVDCYGHNAFNKAASYLGGDATGVAAGGGHTCFLLSGGAATCQGLDADGQAAGRASAVVSLAAGTYHTCYVLADASVDCMGKNDRGQAADDATGDVLQVSAGRYHTCALTASATVRCWGQLAQPVPSAVQGNALAIASGRDHACALVTGGNVLCWGATRDGQSAGYAGGQAIAIAAGDSHACALLADATIACWGAVGPADHGQATAYPTAAPAGAPASSSLSSSSSFVSTDLPRPRFARTEEA